MQKIVLIAILLVYFSAANAQKAYEIDEHLVTYMTELENAVDSNEDSVGSVDYDLMAYLKKICVNNPVDISLPKAIQNGLSIITSEDHMIRIYTWDSWLGGSLHKYNSLAVYKTVSGNKTYTIHDETDVTQDYNSSGFSEGGYDYYRIMPIKSKNKITTYIIFGNSIESTSERGEQVIAFRIANKELNRIPFFKTSKKTIDNISYYYNVFNYMEKYKGKGDVPKMHLSKDCKKLYIPVVSGPFNEDITNKYLVYIFDGNQFVFDKNAK